MSRIKLEEDIKPLSEFRSKVAFYFDKVKKTKRPLIITQNGKSTAILMGVAEYEEMLDKIELFEDIRVAEEQINDHLAIEHKIVKERFSNRV
ncbi:MAG: type II toxin-antitoxin system Phd/YefM family antitoxin [Ignavibacteriaceae bacterium]|jgi:prevent-host-death family protein|nr:type II toxin-antitoxin system Phd/YefM family antitoxin [Ignavibacteriaceae bacterium]